MRSPELISEDGGYQYTTLPLQSCDCCPYGYHIDLDFIQYIERRAANQIEPASDGELLRRDKRRSRLSKEFMLGLENLYNSWEPIGGAVQPVPEAQFESEPESPRYHNRSVYDDMQWFDNAHTHSLHSSESPLHSLTSSLTTNSPPETSAFLHDALDEVVSDFEKTLERTKSTRHQNKSGGGNRAKRNGYYRNSTLASDATSPNATATSWEYQMQDDKLYSDAIDSCISNSKFSADESDFANNSYGPKYQRESAKHNQSNKYEVDGSFLSRQHLTDNAKRIRELEEKLSAVPNLQKQVDTLQSQKYHLEMQLRLEEEQNQKLKKQLQQSPPEPPMRTSSTNITHTLHKTSPQFTPQRISPVSLESLGSRIRTNSQSSEQTQEQQQAAPIPPQRKIQKRDASTMCHPPSQRDVGTYITHSMTTRTIGTDPTLAVGIKSMLYTKQDVDNIVQRSLIEHEESKARIRHRTQITVGTQMVAAPKAEPRNAYVQTLQEKPVHKLTQSCMAKPLQRDQVINCRPETKSVGSSEHKTTDTFCEKCTSPKRTVSCGPDEKETKSYLKQMELGARSLTFTLGENEKLNIKRKTIGTQYDKNSNDIGVQSQIASASIGIQNSPQSHSKSSQYFALGPISSVKQTDTRDLISLTSSYTNTNAVEEKPPIATNNSSCNTDALQTKELGTNTDVLRTRENGMNTNVLRTREHGINTERMRTRDNETNTLPDVSTLKIKTKNSASNTEEVRKKDIACGEIAAKPHIHIACADNYCDSCKDSIKNLAKEFTKSRSAASVSPARGVSPSPPSSLTAEQSRIPRPTALPSPNSPRRAFVRQNTYTLPSPERSPSKDKGYESKSATPQASEQDYSTSLDSVIKTTKITKTTIVKRRSPENDSRSVSSSPTKTFFDKTLDAATAVNSEPESDQAQQSSTKPLAAPRTLEQKTVEGPKAESSTSQPVQESSKDADTPAATSRISPEREYSPPPLSASKASSSKQNLTEDSAAAIPTTSQHSDTDNDKRAVAGTSASCEHHATGNDDAGESKIDRRVYPETSRGATSRAMQNILLNQIATAASEPREKASPSKEMKAALKVINDSLQKSTSKSSNLKNANAIVQKEWFKISSVDQANPLNVEDYLDCFEDYSIQLLKYMVNLTDVNGNSAMHYAVSHGNFDIVSILLDSKVCNVNQTNNAGYTCVMLVSLAKLKISAHRTVVQRLFQMADVNIRAKKHCQTALMLAVSHGNLDMVEMLLKAGADINIQDEDGSTSLMCAAEHGRIDIVKFLLSQPDCDSLIQDVDGSTAFKIAWQAEHRDIGLLLYVHEQMLRSKMPNQKSPVTPRHSNKQQQLQPPQSQNQSQTTERPNSPQK